jgi:hypothetical protein
MLQWYKKLRPRWQLAIVWIPSSAAIMAIISWFSFEDPAAVAAGLVVGAIMGISSFIYVVRTGGW